MSLPVCGSGAEAYMSCVRVRRRRKPSTQVLVAAVARDRQAQQRADVDTGVTLNATGLYEYCFDVAIQAALNLARGLFG
jgi:hypothetical protein